MAKARVGLYNTKGEQLTRTHKSCPKCGPGTFLAEHPNRRSCGKCGIRGQDVRPGPDPGPRAREGQGREAGVVRSRSGSRRIAGRSGRNPYVASA